jgi:iron complex outermembrane recepter protein
VRGFTSTARRGPAAWRAGLATAIWSVAVLVPIPSSGQEETRPPAAPAPREGEPLVEEIDVSAPLRLPEGPSRGDGLTVQVIDAAELERSGAQTVQEGLRRLPGLNLSDEQGNRLQLDLTLRGFTASPVTGIPQGLSVFVDGVRVNEPAVEEVNFDLIPLEDVERIEVIRGPSAIYGRNTLGGAINIVTRRGGRSLEAEAEAEAGSWEQQGLRGHVSGPLGPLDGYLSAGELSERGWRVDGGARGVRAFAKLGWEREGTDVWLSYQFQRDHIQQPGSLPESLLREDPRQNYTTGDFFQPALDFLTVNAHQGLAPGLSLAANGFLRILSTEQFNSSLLAPDTRMFNDTRSLGVALQLDHRATLGAIRNQATAGAEATRSTVHVLVRQEPNARFPSPAPIAGDLHDGQVGLGAYLQDWLQITEGPLAGLGARAALRFDRISHDITGSASGSVAYSAWLPAAGVTWAFAPRWLASLSWSQGVRAPAFLELTCADPAAPCIGLQSGVAADPTFTPLRPVRSNAFEAGVAGSPIPGVTASASGFLVDLHDDIYSVSGATTNTVYFQNVGATRRQGLELTLRVRQGIVEAGGSYAFTLATFQDHLTLGTPRTSGGEQVRPGDRLPLVPEQLLDLDGRIRPLPWLSLYAGALFVGSQYFRGDEANEAPRLPSYWLVRAGVEGLWGRWSATLRATNLLNASYQTFGTFAPDGRLPGTPPPTVPFLTPGRPLGVLLGIRWEVG